MNFSLGVKSSCSRSLQVELVGLNKAREQCVSRPAKAENLICSVRSTVETVKSHVFSLDLAIFGNFGVLAIFMLSDF